ncbi:unnamed protein product [Adineta steineri]|uniref:Uncharacterized protein n=1 Tax=Adineta steineri TaxID=433720 RepID=A0A815VDN0_9BILA|nr:unnamed protein product [Adineta steineri]
MSRKEQCLSTSSDDEISHTTKLKTIRQINEYYSITNSTVAAEQQLSHHHPTNFTCQSTTSIDSIENKLSTPTPVRTTTTFSNLSSQRISNPTQIQRSGPKMGTTTLTRTFAFDRACMEKYGQVQKQKPESIQIPKIPVNDIKIKKDIGLPPKTMKPPPIPPSPKGSLSCRSFISNMQTSLYNGSEAATIDDYECQHHSSTVTTTFGSKSLTKPSNVLYLMKKCARTVTSDHYATNNLNENTPAEPKLLQVKYLDGRLPLKNIQTGELPRKTQTFSASISSRLNKIGLSKLSLTQDFSSTTSLNSSYRNRVFNRFRSLVDNNSSESSQSKPWQHKTITELFQDRKHKH